MRHYFGKHPSRCLLVTSDPQNHMGNDEMANLFRTAFEHPGFLIHCFVLWDARYSHLITLAEFLVFTSLYISCVAVVATVKWEMVGSKAAVGTVIFSGVSHRLGLHRR